MIATNAYQRLALAVQKPLNFAPILLLLAAIVFTTTYGIEEIHIYRYIWIPWLLHGLLTVTAFHPFDLDPEDRSAIMLYWLASWLYPLGFGTVVFLGRQLAEPGGVSIWPPILFGWMGWFYLRQYRARYAEAQLSQVYAKEWSYEDEAPLDDNRRWRSDWDDEDDR